MGSSTAERTESKRLDILCGEKLQGRSSIGIRAIVVAAALFLAAFSRAQAPAQGEGVISIDDFKSCGFISRFAPNKINKECLQDQRNLFIDTDWSLQRRGGYAAYNPTPCTSGQQIRGLWPFYATDGSQYIVIQSTGSMFYSKGDGTCNAITGLGNLSTSAQMNCVQALGYLWCVNGVDQPFRTNITSTDTIAGAPIGKYIGTFRNRIVISGVGANLTRVYLSGELDGTDWTLPTVTYSTSPAILSVNGTNDGLAVSCLMGEFQNNFYIGRNYDLYGLSGYDLRDFTIRKVSNQIGCMEQKSVQEVNNVLYWMSHRGIEGLTGTEIQRVSYPVDPTIQTIIAAAGNSQAQTLTSQADWQSGNLTASGPGAPISATISPGDLMPSSATLTLNSTASFALGTLLNVSTTSSGIMLSSYTFQDDFSDGDYTSSPTWTVSECTPGNYYSVTGGELKFLAPAGTGGYRCVLSNPVTSSTGSWTYRARLNGSTSDNGAHQFFFMSSGQLATTTNGYMVEARDNLNIRVEFYLYRVDSGVLTMLSSATYNGGIVDYTITVTRSNSGYMKVTGGPATLEATDATYGSSSYVLLNMTGNVTSAVNTGVSFYTDNIYHYRYLSSGTQVSPIFDTGFSTPIASALSFSTSAPIGTTISFVVRQSTSPNNDMWSAWQSVTDTTTLLGLTKRYWQEGSTFTTTGASTSTPVLTSISLFAKTTGYYITPCISISSITSWGVFGVDGVTNNGSLSFWVSTGTTCNSVTRTTATWTSQTANSIISVATSTYIGARVLFDLTDPNYNPVLNDITFNWNAGASRPPVASAPYHDQYWVFYTTSQANGAVNDHAIVFDQNRHWALMDDIYASAAAIYLNSLYVGDSRNTGTVYLMDTGSADNGGNFTMRFETPDLDADDPLSIKEFKRAYLLIGGPTSNTSGESLSCTYRINGSSVSYSLGSVSLTESPESGGYFVAKLPFPSGQAAKGNWLSMACTNVGSNGPLRVYGIKIVYTKEDWP